MPHKLTSRLIRFILCPLAQSVIMEYVYAALLLHKLHKDVNEENIKAVVSAAGVDVNEAQAKSLVAALADVDISEAIQAAPVAMAAAAPVEAPQETTDTPDEEEEEDKEKDEDEAMEGLSSLFG